MHRSAASLLLALALLAASCGRDSTQGRLNPNHVFLGAAINRQGGVVGDPLFTNAYLSVSRAHMRHVTWSVDWGTIEARAGTSNWAPLVRQIQEARLNGVRLAVLVLLVENQVRGRVPDDLSEFWIDDPFFRARLGDFLQELLAYAQGTVEQIWIGRDVDAYLDQNRNEIDPYLAMVHECRDSALVVDPLVDVGLCVSYSEALEADRLDLVDRLVLPGSVTGLAVYGRDRDHDQVLGPAETLARVREAVDRYPAAAVALSEVGYPGEGVADGEQEAFVQGLLSYLSDAPAQLEGAYWYALHDFTPAEAQEAATRVFAGEPEREANYAEDLRRGGLLLESGVARAAFYRVRDWVQP